MTTNSHSRLRPVTYWFLVLLFMFGLFGPYLYGGRVSIVNTLSTLGVCLVIVTIFGVRRQYGLGIAIAMILPLLLGAFLEVWDRLFLGTADRGVLVVMVFVGLGIGALAILVYAVAGKCVGQAGIKILDEIAQFGVYLARAAKPLCAFAVVFTIFVFMFGGIYASMYRSNPENFRYTNNMEEQSEQGPNDSHVIADPASAMCDIETHPGILDFVHLSLAAMTGLTCEDLQPVRLPSRRLVTFQAISGIFVLAIFLGFLVEYVAQTHWGDPTLAAQLHRDMRRLIGHLSGHDCEVREEDTGADDEQAEVDNGN